MAQRKMNPLIGSETVSRLPGQSVHSLAYPCPASFKAHAYHCNEHSALTNARTRESIRVQGVGRGIF